MDVDIDICTDIDIGIDIAIDVYVNIHMYVCTCVRMCGQASGFSKPSPPQWYGLGGGGGRVLRGLLGPASTLTPT